MKILPTRSGQEGTHSNFHSNFFFIKVNKYVDTRNVTSAISSIPVSSSSYTRTIQLYPSPQVHQIKTEIGGHGHEFGQECQYWDTSKLQTSDTNSDSDTDWDTHVRRTLDQNIKCCISNMQIEILYTSQVIKNSALLKSGFSVLILI